MQFETEQTIAAPAPFVFAKLTDFDLFQALAAKQDITVTCQTAGKARLGTIWDITASYRKRQYDIRAELTRFDENEGCAVTARSDGLLAVTTVDLLSVGLDRTTVTLTCQLQATKLSARLLLQPVKLAHGRMSQALDARAARIAARIAQDYAADPSSAGS